MRSIHLLPLCLLLACGDNKDKQRPPDGGLLPDGPAVDMMVVPVCTYTEMADATNDDLFGSGTPEATGISFTGTTTVICGQINPGHFNTTQMNVDVDSYRITVPSETRGILYFTAPGAEELQSTAIEISGLTTTSAVSEVGVFVDDYAVTSAPLPPGDYLITVSSYNQADIAAAIDYRLTIEMDSATRCPRVTADADYTEANDGVTASGNDVYEVRYSGNPRRQFTAITTDAPEPTGITVDTNVSYRVSGTSDLPVTAPVSWLDAYQDRDTYAITMGATTNMLSVRVNWPGTTADLDVFVFPMNELNEIATGWYNANMEDEFTTLAVTPGATYWVMVAADDDSTGLPVDYDITLCGSAYSPPTASSRATRGRARFHPVFQREIRPLARK
jgi:hypothetical protein